MNSPILLGVNIDHIATIRNARGTNYPEPVYAASIAEQSGADSITVHLREDRRHITDRDVFLLKDTLQTHMNFEMAVTDEMLAIAEQLLPTYACFVPEKREELTTEGGLNVIENEQRVTQACHRLSEKGIQVSLFIDADLKQIDAAKRSGATIIELHTGGYAEAENAAFADAELRRIKQAATHAHQLGLQVNAGHGLHYHNVQRIAAIPEVVELNIGHAIIGRAVFSGLDKAVAEMKRLMVEAR
ncbi:pyridoxine 5'-phosphate synthase [Pleionea litopenaei]|uniref:Pyridoxine 5'-phosphate synthase n=1 Tax=Pleionea litopenaei TaxID=3070815 RepID=A0AA51X7Q8_9GAMM|nr:pyridoxine 5'-phosphate synthase [Pleionea sp. HL-JVS1]WMS88582.1 pyridoxine 5'-phosphate synthase [Pleionea sp. HL-JVS1]